MYDLYDMRGYLFVKCALGDIARTNNRNNNECMTRYVALYCRISKDKRGRAEGVRAQEKWGREYAAHQEGWRGLPIRVFVDNNISAASGDRREGYEALREAIKRGDVAQLWAVEQSRLERREIEWFNLAGELEDAGISELHTNREGVVRVRDVVAGIKAVLNADYVRGNKRKLMDTLEEKAKGGQPPGSRPYGYLHGKTERGVKTLVIAEAEAAVIREAADRVLAGWSLSSIAADLRERGLHGPHRVKVVDHQCGGDRRKKCGCPIVTLDGTPVEDGGEPVTRPSTITHESVKKWLTNATVAGIRVHQGAEIGKGNWTAILDEHTWRAVQNKLASPRVVQRSDGGTYPITPTTRTTGRRYLLTGGTAICGNENCGAPLVAQMKQFTKKPKGGPRTIWKIVPYYGCHPKTGGKGCVGIMGDRFEAYVVERLFDELDKPAFLDALAADEHAARREEIDVALQALAQQKTQLASAWARRREMRNPLSVDEWMAARDGLVDEERRLRSEHATIPMPVTGVDPTKIRAAWDKMTLDEQRNIISVCIDRVVVKRAKPGTTGFDAGRVDIDWRY